MVENNYFMYYNTIKMENIFETFPDDLRLRYKICWRFHHEAPNFPPVVCCPYTIIAGLAGGEAVIRFSDRSKTPVRLKGGEVCILPANCRHQTGTLSPGGVEFIAAELLFEIRGGMDFLNFFDLPPHLDKSMNGILFHLLEELLGLERDFQGRQDLRRNVSRQRIGYAMLENILRVAAPKQGMLPMRRILPAIEHLNDNFTSKPDLPKLVKLSGLSRTHFFRMFKNQTGTTPIEYVKRQRLREALLLLQESDLTVAEIADKTGWQDPFYFSKIFKSEIGAPPSAYRLRYKNIY